MRVVSDNDIDQESSTTTARIGFSQLIMRLFQDRASSNISNAVTSTARNPAIVDSGFAQLAGRPLQQPGHTLTPRKDKAE